MALDPRRVLMARFPLIFAAGFGLLVATLAWASVEWLPQTAYYPRLVVSPAAEFSLEFLLSGEVEAQVCEQRLLAMRKGLQSKCPDCRVDASCAHGLTSLHRQSLGNDPLAEASMRVTDGTVLVRVGKPNEAMAVCSAISQQMAIAQSAPARYSCIPAGARRSGT